MQQKSATSPAVAHSIDLHVGSRIKYRRTEIGLSQSNLCEKLGVSYQQIQKYEKAKDRVSASRLWEISQALEVEPQYFYLDYKPKENFRKAYLKPPPAWWSQLYHGLDKKQLTVLKQFIKTLKTLSQSDERIL